jgi:hypothetical protein
LISEILQLQDDFEALSNRSNQLQHENHYFEQQIEDFLVQLEEAEQQGTSKQE